ncbi:ACP S-malonyltransferase [Aphanothece sacrum]|uniref:Malonyl CoA-acyl carrier protein transacylase n=1 Tax=Aphanothece sacrum FPU1 TaxID=1920663 RepID=A0A401IIF6_APHSA|nr:ACP S-malonyltransferase [Aphanothece sacrum]GBF80891.1 malonyl CoA-acyl carrier protein transacylase [Aphanothece sacrum FPU1]GBF85198.1 malonyl CoA-acyl carrier protein transacylase [Aphanothece sacrum FPU3]
MKIAWVFPGQGSQIVGMGVDLQETPIGQAKFEQAEDILGWSVLEKCQAQETELSRTLYTQPCLYVIESILADLLVQNGQLPDLVAGHSLGEYSALYAARSFDFTTGLELVKRRAELMDKALGGKMAALMKFDRQQLEDAIAANADVVLANDNSEEQVVISGTPEGVDAILAQVKAKRAVPLKVSGAFHSPFMTDAAQEFQGLLDSCKFADAKVPVLSNVDPTPTQSATMLKERLMKQMTGSVRWREIMLCLPQEGITHGVEVGPGKVLTGLIKRTCPEIKLTNVGKMSEL